MVFYQAYLYKKWLWALPNCYQTIRFLRCQLNHYIHLIFNFERVITFSAQSVRFVALGHYPLGTRRKLNVTFRRRPGHLRNVLCAFSLRRLSRRWMALFVLHRVADITDSLTRAFARATVSFTWRACQHTKIK